METNKDDKTPMMGSWNGLYALVIGVLILLIVSFYFFTITFE
jgi:hypothetical protein